MNKQADVFDGVAIYHRSAIAGPDCILKRERCQNYCLSRWGVHGVLFEDVGVSGRTFCRPALDSLMRQTQAGLIKILVVYDFNALGRSGQTVSWSTL